MPGMTTYMGLLEIGKPAAGETVVVAAASTASFPPIANKLFDKRAS
jgi:NADPH-dependent curcumin reductase CurA